MPPRWHHHVSPAAASLTAPRRCVVDLTKSVGAQLGMKEVGITNQRRHFFLQIMAHYGRLLRASVWMEWMRSPLVCLLHWVFYRSPKCAHQHQLSIDMVHWHGNVQSNLISSNLFCTKPPRSPQTCFRQQNPSSDSGCDSKHESLTCHKEWVMSQQTKDEVRLGVNATKNKHYHKPPETTTAALSCFVELRSKRANDNESSTFHLHSLRCHCFV